MTDDELREIVANLALSQAKTDEQLAKTDEQLAKTDGQLAKTDAQLAKTDEKLNKLAESQAKTDEKLNKLAESQAKTDEKLNKLAESQAKTDEKLNKLAESQAKTDEKLNKLAESQAKTDAKLNKLADMYGGVGNNQGKVAEEFYYNSLKHTLELNGIQFDFIEKNVTRSKGGIEEEYDLLLVNGKDVFIIEVKYRLHPKDIDSLVGRKRSNFMTLFSEYRDYKIHLALASFAIDEEVKRMALEQGVTLLQRRGHVIETLAA